MADIAVAFRRARRVTAICHEHPDADTLGAATACAMIAERLGAASEVLTRDPPPASWCWLPGANELASRPTFDPDLVVLCDCATLDRIGPHDAAWADRLEGATLVNIDHHVTNTYFGHLNLVRPEASATSELVVEVVRELGIRLDRDLATVLLAGIVRDTRGFSDPSTSASTLRIAADLVEAGAPLARVARSVLGNQSREALSLWTRVLGELRAAAGGRVVCGAVTLDMLRDTGAEPEDADGLVELLGSAEGVGVAILVRELTPDSTRFSIRCTDGVNAHAVAAVFSGGGHATRAGGTIRGSVEDALQRVLAEAVRRIGQG